MEGVSLVGSRADGREHELSDWDLSVTTSDFERLAEDLPMLVSSLGPLAQQWDPYADHEAYMLIFAGPTKVDLCFFDVPREWSQPWEVRPDTLEAIDRHFWDWILWLEQKRRGRHAGKVAESLKHMYELMLRPMGVAEPPASLPDALDAYLTARERLESEFGLRAPRTLERAVRPVVER